MYNVYIEPDKIYYLLHQKAGKKLQNFFFSSKTDFKKFFLKTDNIIFLKKLKIPFKLIHEDNSRYCRLTFSPLHRLSTCCWSLDQRCLNIVFLACIGIPSQRKGSPHPC